MTEPITLLEILNAAPGDAPAIVLPEMGVTISYKSLREQVMRMAEALVAIGIRPGDRVATVQPNGLGAIVSFLAASFAGTAAPLNPGYRQEEFAFFLEDTNAKVLLCPPTGADDARRAADGKVPVYTIATIEDGDRKGHVEITGAPSTIGHSAPTPAPSDVALVLHTSGSTGRPKRVPIRHANLAVSARNVGNTYQLSSSDISLCVMPLFHVHGLVASTLATLRTGGSIVVPSKFNALSFWRTVRETHATWYSAVPTIHGMVLARAGNERPAGCESLRFIRSCSASLAPEMMHKMEERFGVPVLEAYGMTEAAHQMASNPLPPNERLAGSVGPGTGVAIAILDDKGNQLAVGERGEVSIRGANVVDGYENNPEANAKSFTNGWFRTGDQGFLNDAGYLTLTGRIKELINRGGEKIAPREIDEILLSHPAISEAVAFGMPHPSWGEEVAAAIVLREPEAATESAIIAYCKERLADFKCPKKLFVVEAIPRTATGKIQRGAVATTLIGAKG